MSQEEPQVLLFACDYLKGEKKKDPFPFIHYTSQKASFPAPFPWNPPVMAAGEVKLLCILWLLSRIKMVEMTIY